MKTFWISSDDFARLVERWAKETELYALRYSQGELHYQKVEDGIQGDGIVYDMVRAVEPLKSFFFKVKEEVARYPSPAPEGLKEPGPRIILGAKACDLKSLEILDGVFTAGEFMEPYYIANRKNTTLISSDCSSPKESCFCTLMGISPYPSSGFDLNLSVIPSVIPSGLLVEVGSKKGAEILDSSLLREATSSEIEERDRNRETTLTKVKAQNERFSFRRSYQEIVKEGMTSPLWEEMARRCLGCAACTIICPTCHCFLLYDQRADEEFERIRVWDFCYYRGFARVGGGANPRPRMSDRFKNRYIHKFDFFPENFGVYGCTGCGRCIEACLAGIDIREVFRELQAT